MNRFIVCLICPALMLGMSGCSLEVFGTGIAGDKQGTVRASNIESVVDENGRCEADMNLDPATLRNRDGAALMGRTECEVVAAKGPPLETIIRSDGPSRLVTMRYSIEKVQTDFIFKDNRLTQINRLSEATPSSKPPKGRKKA